ncbi:maltose alpha-D-glucosyltransferase [Pleurocapsales cyanobacterium LEGE 06147]|nr:maltose alpha-D-glucosyltransferase [Pleurocapsales cyanobacterium LEGE 06147]
MHLTTSTTTQEHLTSLQYTIALKDDPLWFKDAIIYEVPVRAYADSNGDGIGDFPGLTTKLDYLQDLGVTALWILPFFPSPLRDDGYDIADYKNVNPIYGTLEDFKEFLDAAHERGIRVIIELIVNHTSDQHPWFQRARKAPPGSKERNYYVWSDTPDKYPEVRIIFQDFEHSNWAWDPVAKAYYWHRFYSHQPDLNYDSPEVQQEVLDVVDFWLEMGVDGMRLDAVPYLFVAEGTNCENLPPTHAFLKRLRAHIDAKFSNRMLLAEANQWPEDAAAYYGHGDECHMNFHFPLMPRLFMALRMEDSFPIADILKQTPSIPDNCQWALFLRNHDELTLEMVSDEDRDYMYRVYAQDPETRLNLGIRRRLAPLLGNDRRQIELMNGLLLSLPGTPVLYYGDEIGMGDNIYVGDRNGVRTPMQWSADRNAGFSRANPHRLYLPVILESEYHYEAVNVEAQRANTNSLWWYMKRLLATRARFKAFGRGTFELLYPDNRKVLAFIRTYDGEHILVVANLSRFVQTVELDLSSFQGMIPVEIFGRTQFPSIGESPYFISISPHSFYWFTLQLPESLNKLPQPQAELPTLSVKGSWHNVFVQKEAKANLESSLVDYLYTRHWFAGVGKIVRSVQIVEAIPIPYQDREANLALVQVEYTEGFPDIYVLPIAYSSSPVEVAIAKIQTGEEKGVLFDALADKDFLFTPLEAIAQGRSYRGSVGKLVATPTEDFANLSQEATNLEPHLFRGKQDNSSIVYGDRFILKIYRKVEPGINPDWEVGRFLSKKQADGHFAPVAGTIEYHRPGSESTVIATVQGFFPDARDAWAYTLDSLRDYFEQVMVKQFDLDETHFPLNPLSAAQTLEIPDFVYEIIGSYLSSAQLLGQRTAELHMTLASDLDNPNFAPEPFTFFYQRSIYQYSRNLAGKVLLSLKKDMGQLPESAQKLAQKILNRQEQILERFGLLLEQKIVAKRIRCHGNYHLGQVLYTGKDFIIIDFKGEKNRPLSERRMKRSPLRDVAGMLQSFSYAANIALYQELDTGVIRRPENLSVIEQWAHFWYRWVSAIFLNAYLTTAAESTFLPKTERELNVLLDAYLLEKTIQELSNQLTKRQRSAWLEIALERILELLEM